MNGPNNRRRRLLCGRIQIYIEPRDLWVGYYHGANAGYLCLLPTVVIRIGFGSQP